MKSWQKALLTLLVASFPAGIWAVRNQNRLGELADARTASAPVTGTDAIEAAVKLKSGELAELDVKIVAAQGEVLKFVERRRSVVKQLEALREDVTNLIQRAEPGDSAHADAKGTVAR